MWIKDSSHTICLFGCIGSDALENITWPHFSTLSCQIRPIQTPNLISLVPKTVFPPTHHPTLAYCPNTNLSLIFSLVYRELPGLKLTSDQQNPHPHLGFCLVCTFSSHGINPHLAILAPPGPQALPSLATQVGVNSQNKAGSQVNGQNSLNWRINNKEVHRVKTDLALASPAPFFWGWQESENTAGF